MNEEKKCNNNWKAKMKKNTWRKFLAMVASVWSVVISRKIDTKLSSSSLTLREEEEEDNSIFNRREETQLAQNLISGTN